MYPHSVIVTTGFRAQFCNSNAGKVTRAAIELAEWSEQPPGPVLNTARYSTPFKGKLLNVSGSGLPEACLGEWHDPKAVCVNTYLTVKSCPYFCFVYLC